LTNTPRVINRRSRVLFISRINRIQQTMKYLLSADEASEKQMDWGSLTWFTSAAQSNSDSLTTGLCILKAREGNPRHYHPNCDEVLHVLEGTIMHSFGDDEFPMGPGDTINIPREVVHNARNTGQTEARLFICFSSSDRQTIEV